MSDAPSPVEIFCSYAPKDKSFFQGLQNHLQVLVNQLRIVLLDSRQIIPGTDRAQAINAQINRASVILLLISADFLASDNCKSEMERALERQHTNEAYVIPIQLREVDMNKVPFEHLQLLPTGKPIDQWRNRDKAFTKVAQGIRNVLENAQSLASGIPPSTLSPLWNIPYPHNRLFTGQEALLTQLAAILKTGGPQALSGLGGIGKTQIAVEYAHRYRQDYKAIFWVRADTREALVSGYVSLASLLNLKGKDDRDQTIIKLAVKNWLETYKGWLLILDNADDLDIINEFLPSKPGGHIFLTTRVHAVSKLAQRIEVEPMSKDMGALFILRGAGLIESG